VQRLNCSVVSDGRHEKIISTTSGKGGDESGVGSLVLFQISFKDAPWRGPNFSYINHVLVYIL
jgi:hypothetical protein